MSGDSSKITQIKLDEIFKDDAFNCRGQIAPIDVHTLVADIEKQGLISPLVVAPWDKDGFKYRLIAGYRRYTALRALRRTEAPCIIREDMVDELNARTLNLSENLQRENLSILQEAKALEALLKLGLNRTDAAAKIGMSPGWVQVRTMLLDLPNEIQLEVNSGAITQKQIRDVYNVYRWEGKEAAQDAVKQYKTAKEKGQKDFVLKKKSDAKSKRQRSKAEALDFMVHLINGPVGPGLHTRLLAWSIGEISTDELEEDLEIFCAEKGTQYNRYVGSYESPGDAPKEASVSPV